MGLDKRAHPLMDIAADRQRHFRFRELGLAHHILHRLANVVLWVLFRPRVNVMQRHVAVFYSQRLIRHHREDMWSVMAVFLVDLDRSCRRGVRRTGRQA